MLIYCNFYSYHTFIKQTLAKKFKFGFLVPEDPLYRIITFITIGTQIIKVFNINNTKLFRIICYEERAYTVQCNVINI